MNDITESRIVRYQDLLEYQSHQIVSKTLIQTESICIILFALDLEEELPAHAFTGQTVIQMLDGKAMVCSEGEPYYLCAGDIIIFPPEVSYSVYAIERFKMMITEINVNGEIEEVI